MLVLLGNADNETKIGSYEFVLCAFSFGTTFFYFLREFNFLVNRNKWCTTNLNKILVKRFAGAVCDTYELKLSTFFQ